MGKGAVMFLLTVGSFGQFIAHNILKCQGVEDNMHFFLLLF